MPVRLDHISDKNKQPIRLDRIDTKPVRLNRIGFGEAFMERPAEKFPFSPVGAGRSAELVAASQRVQSDKYDKPPIVGIAPSPAKALLGGGYYTAVSQMALHPKEAMKRWTPERQKQFDVDTLTNFFEDLDKKQQRGYTTMGRVGQITSEMPAFMIEFIATGGLAKLGSESAKRGATRALGQYATTKAGKAALATGGFAAGSLARAAGMPHRAAESILKRQIPKDIRISKDGKITVIGPVEKPMTSIWKGLADHWIEIASEQAGEVISPFASKYLRKMPLMGKLTSALQRRWLKLNAGKTVSDFTKKILKPGGFHGVLTEVGEEYLGNITRAITTVDDFGAGEDANMLERVSAGVKQDNANLVPMLISFGIPGVVGKVVDIKATRELKAEQKYIAEEIHKINSAFNTPQGIETAEGFIGFEDEFFDVQERIAEERKPQFKAPGIGKIFTPKWLLNRLMGIEPIMADVEAAELTRGLEEQHLGGWITKIMKQLKKQASLDDRIAARIANKPIEPVSRMRDLLDQYEKAPDFLNKEDTRIFNQIRELTIYMRDRANIQRERLGLPIIEKVEGYITHWMDAISQQMVKDLDKFPVQSGYLYKIMRGLPKKVKNPTALKRQVKKSMEKYFSKDLNALLRTMVKYDLKDIYITAPYQAAWEELNELRRNQEIPDSVFREAENYLSYDIRKFKTPLDKALDATLEKPIDFINKFLLPYNRQIQSPSRSLFRAFRRIAHLSGLAMRPRPAIRNLGQRLLNMDFYRASDLAKAQFAPVPIVIHPITGEQINLMDLVREQDWYKASLRKFMEVDSTIRGVEAVSMMPYSRTHVGNRYLSNVEISALTGYYDWQYRYQQSQDKNSKHYKHCKKMARKLGIPIENLLTQPGDMMGDIREAIRRTQWEYMSISMPVAYRGEFAKASLVFQSWWMNYFFNHMREAINQTMTGRNSKGRALTPYGRLRAAKGTGSIVAIGKIAQTLFGIQMLKYLFLPAPGYLPPIPEFVVGVTQFIGADDDKERKQALKRIKRSLSILIPYRAAWRDLNKLLSGEYDIWDYLVYRKQKK